MYKDFDRSSFRVETIPFHTTIPFLKAQFFDWIPFYTWWKQYSSHKPPFIHFLLIYYVLHFLFLLICFPFFKSRLNDFERKKRPRFPSIPSINVECMSPSTQKWRTWSWSTFVKLLKWEPMFISWSITIRKVKRNFLSSSNEKEEIHSREVSLFPPFSGTRYSSTGTLNDI